MPSPLPFSVMHYLKKLLTGKKAILNENGSVIVKVDKDGTPISFDGKDVSDDLKSKIASNF
jgi:hypothetical protein